jgi:four helix bundle protein
MSKSDEMRLRTRRFAGEVVRFFVTLDRKREELRVLGKQLLRAGTSVGANYREASRAGSDSEFVAKIELCTQEADETQYWLELLKEMTAVCGQRISKESGARPMNSFVFSSPCQKTRKRKRQPKAET